MNPIRNHRILIVEDHPETRFMLELAFEDAFDIVAVDGPSPALELADREHFDACLLDISLRDDIDGVELMQRLRAHPDYADTPIVAMTAHYMDDEGESLLDEGFDAFVQKPFKPDELRAVLEYVEARPHDSSGTSATRPRGGSV